MGISRPIFQSYQNLRVLTYDRSYKWNLNVHERICVKKNVYSCQQTYPWAKSPQKSWLKDRLLEYNMQ